jgi:hypothetical protein
VLADEGTVYEDLGTCRGRQAAYQAPEGGLRNRPRRLVEGRVHRPLQPQTHRLELLLYNVTFSSPASKPPSIACFYTDWQQVDARCCPAMEAVRENDKIGDLRYQAEFSNGSDPRPTRRQPVRVGAPGFSAAENDSYKGGRYFIDRSFKYLEEPEGPAPI